MTPSWDLFIILFFVIMTIYGLLLGKGRVLNILINSYIGYVIAVELSGLVYDQISTVPSLPQGFSASMFAVKVLLFVSVIFIMTLRSELITSSKDSSANNVIYTAIYGFLSAGLITSSIFSFMGDAERMSLLSGSPIAENVYTFRLLWLVAPIIVVVITGILKKVFGK